jgi:pimeloyl-ACP methyl ester carboxylesterase
MSSIGARYSNRIAALVYLDAAWDRTYVLPKDEARSADFDKVGIPSQPKPNPERFDPRDALGAGVQKPDYARVRVPALALYAAPGTWTEMVPGSSEFADPEKRAAAKRIIEYAAQTRQVMEEMFRSGVADSRVVEIPGASHYLFQTKRAEALRNIRAFLEGLQ